MYKGSAFYPYNWFDSQKRQLLFFWVHSIIRLVFTMKSLSDCCTMDTELLNIYYTKFYPCPTQKGGRKERKTSASLYVMTCRLTEPVGHNSLPASVNVTSTLHFQTPSLHSCSDLSFNALKLINSECRNFHTCLQAPTPILFLPAAQNFGFPFNPHSDKPIPFKAFRSDFSAFIQPPSFKATRVLSVMSPDLSYVGRTQRWNQAILQKPIWHKYLMHFAPFFTK